MKEGNVEQAMNEFNISENDLQVLVNSIDSIIEKDGYSKNHHEAEKNNREIGRITLHITNDCNLRCRYCYASGGSYNLDRELMSLETAEKFVDFCIKNFDKIGNIVFFGGEPMMNVEVMEFVCNKFNNYHKNGTIKYIPQFGIITNGTILNSRIISLLNQYISFITVSIDGPKELNDYNRIFANGTGSYEKIEKFIRTVKNETNVDIRYEATFTEYHIKQKITNDSLKDFFTQEFQLEGIITDELSVESKMHNEYWNILKNDFFSEVDMKNIPEGFWSVLASIVNKRAKNMCLISHNIFAVSTKGEIYPCHMNTGESNSSLGNISGVNIFNDKDKYKKQIPLLFLINKREKICTNCWAQNICGGCAIRWFYDEDTKKYTSKPKKELCEANKKHLEKILVLIAHLRKDRHKWNKFLSYVETNNNSIAL